MLYMPPRHGKSELVTVRYATWSLERHPEVRIIIGGYNQFIANIFSRKIKRIAHARIEMGKDRVAVEEWQTAAGGGVRAVGVGGGVTGQGGDLIIIDDPIKSRAEAESEAYRDSVWNWYTNDLYTRREPGAKMIIIQTRWHQDDLAGRILASEDGPNWTVINLPAEAEVNDPLGRQEGEALCPERFDLPALAGIKTVLGTYGYQALYQQRPAPSGGGIVKLSWFRRYRTPPAEVVRIVQSWDTAQKAGELHDPWVCTTWQEAPQGYFLLDVYRKRMEYPEGKRAAMSLAEKWKPHVILIEDKSSGQSLIQELRNERKNLPILAVDPASDKVTRMSVETPILEAGRVWLPESAAWLLEYEAELSGFPTSTHNDQVDSTSQFLAWMRMRSGPIAYETVTSRASLGPGRGAY